MKQTRQSMECAGSLTPELEGAERTSPHTTRARPDRTAPKIQKGGEKHE